MRSCNFREKGKTITELSSDHNPALIQALGYLSPPPLPFSFLNGAFMSRTYNGLNPHNRTCQSFSAIIMC